MRTPRVHGKGQVHVLRPHFLFHRELLTELARAGYETVHVLMAAPVDDKNVLEATAGRWF